MNTTKDIVLGRAIFGTSDGLQAYGNGILSDAVNNPWIFEFENIGRTRNSPLRQFSIETPVLFCRQIADNQGRATLILGVIAPCMDVHSRPGFLGACVAIQIDRPDLKTDITESWEPALQEVFELYYEYAVKMVHPENNTLHLKSVFKPTPSDKQYNWQHSSSNEYFFHYDDNQHDDNFVCDSMQAIMLYHANKISGFLFFSGLVPNSINIQTDWVQRDRKNLVDLRIKSSLSPLELETPPIEPNPKNTSSSELSSKIQRLQDDVTALQTQISELHYDLSLVKTRRHLSSGPQNESFGIFSSQGDDDKRKMIFRLGLAGTFIIVALLVITLFFWMMRAPSGENTPLELDGRSSAIE